MHQRELIYSVPRIASGWELSEVTMPESVVHDQAAELLRQLLSWWARGSENAYVARNLAIRWEESEPRIGVDPDVCLLSPAPPDVMQLASVRTWLGGHAPPALAIEVVSENHPHKDYVVAPDKYAACGARELWIFDPLLAGPQSHGGPFRLQVWTRDEHGRFTRTHAGEGPARSPLLDAYLLPTDEGRKLRISADAEGTSWWLTESEDERAAKEQERAAKEQALARIVELEAELHRRER